MKVQMILPTLKFRLPYYPNRRMLNWQDKKKLDDALYAIRHIAHRTRFLLKRCGRELNSGIGRGKPMSITKQRKMEQEHRILQKIEANRMKESWEKKERELSGFGRGTMPVVETEKKRNTNYGLYGVRESSVKEVRLNNAPVLSTAEMLSLAGVVTHNPEWSELPD